MDKLTQALLQRIGSKTSASLRFGTFSRVESAGQVVIVTSPDGTAIWRCSPGSSYRPEPGEEVAVLFIDGQPYFIGSGQSKPGRGTVATVSSGVATVQTDIGVITCSYTTTPTSGQNVRLAWQDGPHILAVGGAFPAQQTPPSDPVYTPRPHTFVFHATDSGTVRYPFDGTNPHTPGTWAPGALSMLGDESQLAYGWWFYGPQIVNTIPPAASIQSIEVFFPPRVGIWSGGIALSPSKTPADAIANLQPFMSGPDPSFYPTSTPPDGWYTYDPSFAVALLNAESSLVPNARGGSNTTPWMPGLDIYGDGQGDDLSGAIRITAIF